jgi:hypothetical protein
MKRITYILATLCFMAWQIAHGNIGKAQGQSQRIVSPMGNIVSISPGTSITQNSAATVFYSETIPANTLLPNRWFPLHMEFTLTTPVISIPGLSVTVQLGSQTFNLMSSAALVGGVNNGLFTIDLKLIAVSNNSQRISATITQPNGSLITLGSSVSPVGSFTVNNAVGNLFTVTIQFTGVGLGTSQLTNFWTLRDAY